MDQRTQILLTAALLGSPFACKSELDDQPDATMEARASRDSIPTPPDPGPDAAAVENQDATIPGGALALDPVTSHVEFVGAKLTGDHTGRFEAKSGHLELAGDTPASLRVAVDIHSLKIEPDRLRNHLLTDDFFAAQTYPDAVFISRKIEEGASGDATHTITGDLTLRGRTNSISFPAAVKATDDAISGSAQFKIKRKDWGIEYPGAPDDLIQDDVLLKLTLHFPRTN